GTCYPPDNAFPPRLEAGRPNQLCLRLPFGQRRGDKRVGVALTQAVGFLQERHDLHMRLALLRTDDVLPVGDRLAILLLDRWEVGCRTFHFFSFAHYSAASRTGAGPKSSGKCVSA